MPRSVPPLNSLRAFESAARLGSFTRAARELHVTPAAISHQIRGLEMYLGVQLFRRTSRRMALTEPALAAAANLREGFERIGQAVDTLRSGARGGTLVLSATPAFATRWLVGRLPGFQKKYPRIQLRIATSTTPVDFEQDDIDVAIRLGRRGLEGVAATELFTEWIAPLASPAFLRGHPIKRPADVIKAPLIHDDSMRKSGRAQGWQEWLRAARVPHAAMPSGTHYDDGHLALQAAAAGAGVALGRLAYAADDLAAKRLRIAQRPIVKPDLVYLLLVPDTKASHPAVLAFQEWVLGEASQFRRVLSRLVAKPD